MTVSRQTPLLISLSLLLAILFMFNTGIVFAQPAQSSPTSMARVVDLGDSRYRVSCLQSAEFCVEEFKRLCPGGYDVEGYGRKDTDHSQIIVDVRCQQHDE